MNQDCSDQLPLLGLFSLKSKNSHAQILKVFCLVLDGFFFTFFFVVHSNTNTFLLFTFYLAGISLRNSKNNTAEICCKY